MTTASSIPQTISNYRARGATLDVGPLCGWRRAQMSWSYLNRRNPLVVTLGRQAIPDPSQWIVEMNLRLRTEAAQ